MIHNTHDFTTSVHPEESFHLDERVRDVSFSEDMFSVYLADGRILAVPIRWYPRLLAAHTDQRLDWSLSEDSSSIIWTTLDERISVQELLWEGPNRHEENRMFENVARVLTADEEQNSEDFEWIEGCVGDVALDGDDEEKRAHARAWAEEILRRYS